MQNETLKPILSQLEKLEVDAGYAEKAESVRTEAIKALANTPAVKNASKVAGSSSAELVADCVVLLRTIKAMQKLVEEKSRSDWKDPQLGQARAHAYIDLWGRTESLLALLDDILAETGDSKASQLSARLEVITEGIKQNFSETSQILLMKGEGELVTPIINWGIAKFDTPGFKQLSGSILKELQSF